MGAVTPSELWCEYAVDPVGIDLPEPRFSWILSSRQRGQVQSAYRILVAGSEEALNGDVGDKWDSGVVASDASVNVPYAGTALASGERCCWKVQVWDGQGAASASSDAATFEMGLLDPGDWSGIWIGAESDLAAPLLRREFTLEQPAGKARLYLCGLGLYELSINGARVGDRVLDPALTDYRERVPYVTHDVTRHLRPGRNVIGVMLGNGWYRGLTEQRYRFADTLKLLLQLNLTDDDGTRTSVVSDTTWQVGRGPIIHNSLQEGESYDARLELPGWDAPGYDASAWSDAREAEPPAGAMFSQLMPPMKVIETRRPQRLTTPRAGIHVFDFGQLFGGWIRIRLQGPAGAQVVIKHSSRLRPGGTIDDDAYPGPRESDTYVLRGDPGGETYEPRFTFHPVHYVQINGLARPPELADVEGKVVHTAVDPSGEFACSNEMLNRIHRNVTWTMRNALKGFPMDCLHREPLGYNEPASVSSLLYTRRHMPLFWSKWLDDIKAARRPDGSLSDWAPELPGSNREHDAAQAGNYPPLVWYLYQYYDDERILADHYPVMRGWVDYLGTIAEGGLITTGWLGDHMLPGPAPGWEEYVAEETPPPLIWTGYYYRGARVVTRAAEVLGRSEDAARYAALAAAIRGSFNAAYFDPGSGNYATGSQTANAFALALGVVPEERRGEVLSNLQREIMETHGGHIHTGHAGTTSVIEALSRHAGTGRRRRDAVRAGHGDHLSRLGLHGEPGRDHHLGVLGAGLGAGAQAQSHGASRRQHDDVGLHRQVLLPLPGGTRRAGIPRLGHHGAGIPRVPDRTPRGRRRDLGTRAHQDRPRRGSIKLEAGGSRTGDRRPDTGQQPRDGRHPQAGVGLGNGVRARTPGLPPRLGYRYRGRRPRRLRELHARRASGRLGGLLLHRHQRPVTRGAAPSGPAECPLPGASIPGSMGASGGGELRTAASS